MMNPAASGCELRIDGRATITVPVVGRVVETLVVDRIRWLMDAERRFTADWLERQRA